MKSECRMKSARFVDQHNKKETKCMICENTVFKVCRITSELVMLTCENCGEPHMISINSDEVGSSLKFWIQETGIED